MKKNLKAFTLVELVVAITIFFAMVITTYIPYAFYQNKAKVNIAIKNIWQSITESRNLAINWLEKEVLVRDTSVTPPVISYEDKNMNIWILFTKEDRNQIQVFAYPFDMDESEVMLDDMTNFNFGWVHEEINENIFLIDTRSFMYPISVQSINLDWITYENIFIAFDAIKWTSQIYSLNSDYTISSINWNELEIVAAFRNAAPGPLRKELKYTPKTNLIDY